MQRFFHTISKDIYNRVFRLMKQDADPRIIAAALHLPLRTVLNVIARLKKSVAPDAKDIFAPASGEGMQNPSVFLDIYFLTKTRYVLLRFVGHLVREQRIAIEQELEKIKSSAWKAIALQMSDVVALDETITEILLGFNEEMKLHQRFVALLDPAAVIESTIATFQIEKKIPIFGTERAFEEEAFAHKFFTTSSKLSKNKFGNSRSS